MKGKIFYYSSSIKKLPKGLMLFIILMLLILIPVILALAITIGITTLIMKSITSFLPKKKITSPKKDDYIEDVEYEEVVEVIENKNSGQTT